MQSIKDFTSKLIDNLQEYYTFALLTIGLPAIAYVYIDWRLAISVFIVTQIAIGVLALKAK